jgi:5-carboxymethyl-2-hydroxymuconate isomerase
MPHAVIEYSENVAGEIIAGDILRLVHDTMQNCGLFEAENIKTRAYAASDFLVGIKGKQGSFVHITLSILNGRTTEQKQTLSTAMIDKLRGPLGNIDQVTVDIVEMDKNIYRKK